MKKVEIKRNIIDPKTKEVKEETRFEITPDIGKCFQSKRTGHKFIHTITGKGLPLFVKEKDIELYNEVSL